MTRATTQPLLVSDVLNERASNASNSPPGPSTLNREHVRRLWQRMTAIYGHRWVSSYGPDDDGDTWMRGLQGILPTEIARGIEACCLTPGGWPPTLPEFRAMCRPPVERREHGAMYREFHKALPAPRDVERGRSVLAQLRGKLTA